MRRDEIRNLTTAIFIYKKKTKPIMELTTFGKIYKRQAFFLGRSFQVDNEFYTYIFQEYL